MAKNGTTLNNLFRDGSTAALQIGNTFQSQDNTGTPVTSPLALTGAVQTLVVPDNAVECILYPVANSLQVSEIVGVTRYDLIAAGAKESVPCAKMNNIYVKGTAADTLYFRFTMI